MEKEYLDQNGLSLYDSLIKQLIGDDNVELISTELNDNYHLNVFYTKGGKPMKMSVDLTPTMTEWVDL